MAHNHGRASECRKGRSWDPEERLSLKLLSPKKIRLWQWTQLGYFTCPLICLPLGGFSGPHIGHQNVDQQTEAAGYFSKKKKIVLFGVKKNWNLESATMVTHVKVPPPQRQDPFKEGKREMGSEGCSKWSPSGKQSSKYRGVSCWVVIASHWLSSCQARISFLLGLAFIVGIESSPFWPPDSVLTQVSVY